MRLAPVALLVWAGCASTAVSPPRSALTLSPAAAASVRATADPSPLLGLEAAIGEAERRFHDAGVTESYTVADKSALLVAQGLDESRAALLVDSILALCLDEEGECASSRVFADADKKTRGLAAVERLFELTGEIGTSRSFPFFARWAARGFYRAKSALERALATRAFRTLGPCAPPDALEVQSERARLDDFAVLNHDGKRWTARAPTPSELEDLAYFMAAVAHEGGTVGAPLEAGPPTLGGSAAPDESREILHAQMKAAWARGDIAAHATFARAYLASLGYPGPLRGQEEESVSWGGARYSYVMRELALSDEMLGQLDEAATLYRRADPGGGACGTTVEFREERQMQGLLRATEPRAGCGPVVLERLYAMSGYRIEAYGPERLAEAGFDLARLYRGAVVTLGRDLPRPELEAALRQAPGALGARAVSRLHERGPEAFEARARGLEGIADTGGKAALGVMTALARQGARGASIRALEILDEMTFGVDNDACDGWMGEGRGSGGSHNPRNVRHLNDHCETRLRDAERGALALEVAPLGRSPDREIREHVAETLGSIGSTKAVPLLQTLARDTWHPEGAQVCGYVGDRAKCHDFFPVREAAADALDAIAHHQEVLRER